MKRLLLTAAFVITLASVYARTQQTVSIAPGFFTGKDYLDMTDSERRAYATGAINGMLVAPFFGAPQDNLVWLKSCTAKMSDEDLSGIITKYVNSQESQLSFNLNIVTFNALRNACPKTK
jgi:hypothetical protein